MGKQLPMLWWCVLQKRTWLDVAPTVILSVHNSERTDKITDSNIQISTEIIILYECETTEKFLA
jgi:hypothetical protein